MSVYNSDKGGEGLPDLERLIERYRVMVYNTALGIVQDADDADDVTQEVFIKLFRKASGFRGESEWSTWIYRITVTTALDFEKEKKRQKRGGLLKRVFTGEEVQAPVFEHPGVLLERKEDAALLFWAIRGLPDNQKTAFILHKIEGLSNREVAEIMNISVAAAESLQVRAVKNIRNRLKKYFDKYD